MKGWIALDIDGTITEEKYSIPPQVIDYLTKVQSEGWNILFVTGRAFSFAFAALTNLPFPFILCPQNGSLTLDMPSKKILFKKYLPKESIPLLETSCEGLQTGPLVYAGYEHSDKCYFQKNRFSEDDLVYIEEIQAREKERWIPVEDLTMDYDFPLVKYFGKLNLMQKIKLRLEAAGSFQTSLIKDPFRPAYYLLLTTDKNASKGAALREVLSHFGKGKLVIAAGDDANDISLLQAADVKIAMPHAPESLRKIADFIAPPINECGIVHALKIAVQHESN